MKRSSWFIGLIMLALSGHAWSVPGVTSAHITQIRQVKSYFNKAGEWNGTTPEREVQWLEGTALQGRDYRVTALAADADQKACARLCAEDLYCAAFTFIPVSGSITVPQCSLKYNGFTAGAQAGAISGLVRALR
ncbi:MAG TPA: PAN domain-containing protein [Oligoflexus sp.]|uniref:PAN domain-containing protein n=1 Tax=Oligoflexus sp. TaxID=1971216 RepID=UPI002D588D50|nr:PAN domain-containing protein [Oligoflexus sp.]HYX35953.1 PAN domain-containing protein [Oligoflexus sp.]